MRCNCNCRRGKPEEVFDMKKLILLPVLTASAAPPIALPLAAGEPTAVSLWQTADTPLGVGAAPAGGHVLAELRTLAQADETTVWLSPRSGELLHNGAAPLPLASLAAGDLLSVGDRWWF